MSTTGRGYGWSHQQQRATALAAFVPSQPCARCGHPIESADDADLGHTDDRTSYLGLEHANRCNRSAAGRESARRRAALTARTRRTEPHPGIAPTRGRGPASHATPSGRPLRIATDPSLVAE